MPPPDIWYSAEPSVPVAKPSDSLCQRATAPLFMTDGGRLSALQMPWPRPAPVRASRPPDWFTTVTRTLRTGVTAKAPACERAATRAVDFAVRAKLTVALFPPPPERLHS
ncbi:hypothetical protein [Streptomyces virginiae]|uniref:hypothetical protein n=1 Tax=Streptomyces virginiae TaxID=1961 RepID=UPI0034480981